MIELSKYAARIAGVAIALAAVGAAHAQDDAKAASSATEDDVMLAARARSHSRFDGLWCGAGLLHGASLQLTQHREAFEGVLRWRDRSRDVNGSIQGTTLRTFSDKAGELVLELEGSNLRIDAAEGKLALARGQSFVRSNAGSCS